MAGERISFFRNRSIDDEVFEIVSSGYFNDNMLSIDYFNWDYPGHTFLYWNTKADGSGTIVNPGDEHILFSNYYAIWDVIYAVNGANLTKVADAIRTKGGTSDSLAFPDGFVSAVNAISTGGGSTSVAAKEVNFRDYDGTIVHSYTPTEFAALTAMPDNPDHSGDAIPLTSQGWNWSFADAQAYAAKYGRLEVGQMYATADGKTHVLIHLEQGRTSPILGCCPNGTVDVDWGDGTAHNTLTGTSVTTVRWTPRHEYAVPGDYDIKLTCTGTMGFYGNYSNNQFCGLLRYTSTGDGRNKVYQNAVRAVYCAAGVSSIGSYAFAYCYNLSNFTVPDSVMSIGQYAFCICCSLSSITIPDNVTSIDSYSFQNCYSLSSITIPNEVTSIGTYAFQSCYSLSNITFSDKMTIINPYSFQNCYSLSSITILDGVKSISTYAFQYCSSLISVTILDSVKSINASAFYQCVSLVELHFQSTTPPTVANANAFSSIPTDCKIYVPAGSLEAYTSATNYPSSSTYTYIEE